MDAADECDYKTKRELVKTLADIKEDATIVRERVNSLEAESDRHSKVHEAVIKGQERHEEKLNKLISASAGRARYEQGLKHGVTGLWVVLVSVAAAVVAWFGKYTS